MEMSQSQESKPFEEMARELAALGAGEGGLPPEIWRAGLSTTVSISIDDPGARDGDGGNGSGEETDPEAVAIWGKIALEAAKIVAAGIAGALGAKAAGGGAKSCTTTESTTVTEEAGKKTTTTTKSTTCTAV